MRRFILMAMAGNWVKQPASLQRGWDPGWRHLPIRNLERRQKTCITVCTSVVVLQHRQASRKNLTHHDAGNIISTTVGKNMLTLQFSSYNIKHFRQYILSFSDTSRAFLPGLDREVPPQVPVLVPPDEEPSPFPVLADSQEAHCAWAPVASSHL